MKTFVDPQYADLVSTIVGCLAERVIDPNEHSRITLGSRNNTQVSGFEMLEQSFDLQFKDLERVPLGSTAQVVRSGFQKILSLTAEDCNPNSWVEIAITTPSMAGEEILVPFGIMEEVTVKKIMNAIVTAANEDGCQLVVGKECLSVIVSIINVPAEYCRSITGVAVTNSEALLTEKDLVQELEARKMIISEHHKCGVAEMHEIQELLLKGGFQLKIFSYEHTNYSKTIIFDEKKVDYHHLYIVHTRGGHYAPIICPSFLTGTDFYCDNCDTGYDEEDVPHKC